MVWASANAESTAAWSTVLVSGSPEVTELEGTMLGPTVILEDGTLALLGTSDSAADDICPEAPGLDCGGLLGTSPG